MSVRLLPPEQRIIRRVTGQAENETQAAFLAAIRKVLAQVDVQGLIQTLADVTAMEAYLAALKDSPAGAELLKDPAAAAAEQRLYLSAKVPTIIGELEVRLEPLMEKLILRAGEIALPTFNETMAIVKPIELEAFQREAIGLSKEITADAITKIGEGARANIREIVSRSFEEGISPSGSAKRIADEIGLDARRAAGFEKFLQDLQENPPDLTQEQIQRLIDREYSRRIKSRALTIARTETSAAAAATQSALWETAVAEGRIPATTYVRQWIRIPAAKPCPICGPLSFKRAKIGGVYVVAGKTYRRPPAHPNCRCGERLVLWHEGDDDLAVA